MDNVIYDSSKGEPKSKNDASKILQDMATTFKERNKVYGDNYKTVGINTNLTHRDSIHDAAVYAAMIESLIPEEDKSE